ncbi:DnaJ domain-containing protein [Xanthobacter autotrophicus DSM 431]|uniref:DnaJ domain-containing protein n=1 Tax=Xanthobacter nonsaccharivorans TaxID=3119912 RepID=UPI0037269D39
MVTLIAGALLLVIALYGLKVWTKADPKVLVAILMRSVAYGAMLGAAAMLVTGRFAAAVPLAVLGIGLLGRLDPNGVGGYLGSLFRKTSAPKVSRVRTAVLELELDHASGDMRGQILAGPHAGRALDQVSVEDLVALRTLCDAQSLALLEAYLDRRAPAWREHAQGNPGGGQMGGAADSPGAMTEQEAYQILGLEPGADASSVRAAHRTLMMKLHPDHGGSSYLAAKINRAKDVILSKHA